MTTIKSRSHWVLQTGIISILVLLLCGCSGSVKHGDPISPADPDQNIGLSDGIASPNNRYTLGVWDFHVDPATQTVTGAQRRSADMHLNLVRLLEEACTDCLVFDNFDFSTPGLLGVDMTIKHPFEGNLALTIFDVRGIFIFDEPEGTYCGFAWGDELPVAVNPDGYTHLFHQSSFPIDPDDPAMFNYYPGKYSFGEKLSAYINPYLAYGKDNPRRMFLPGTEETRTLQITLPGVPFDFGYAIDACWALPSVDPVVDPVTDFPISANCYEAYQINVEVGEGLSMFPLSQAKIKVEIFDHQGLDTIDSYGMSSTKNIGAYLWTPNCEWAGSILPMDSNHFEFSTSTGEDSFLFTAILLSPSGTIGEGNYALELYVNDSEDDPNLGHISAGQIFPVSLPEGSDALPIAEATAYPVPQSVGKPIQFFENGSYDPDGGDIVMWEWDWDNDGIFDDVGTPINHAFDTPGIHLVNLRVTDDEGSTRTLWDPLEIEIKEGPGWARTWGGWLSDAAYDVDTDDSGNVYVTGYWSAPTDFDPAPSEEHRPNWPDFDGYISKFDIDGNFIWARTMGGDSSDIPEAITIDDSGTIFVAGAFLYDLNFDGDSTHEVFYSNGSSDIFLCSYGPDGEFKWAKTWGGSNGDGPWELCLDSAGNILIGGLFEGTVDFDPGPGTEERTSHKESDAFLQKLTPNGEFIWVRTWGTEPKDTWHYRNWVKGISVDSNDDVYCIGVFDGIVDFDPGPETDYRTIVGWFSDYTLLKSDIFMSKFNSAGEYQWVRTWGGDSIDRGFGITIDNMDNITTIGFYSGTADFDPGPGVYELTETGYKMEPFISRFNTDGEFIWVKSWPAQLDHNDTGLAIASDNENNIYVNGIFSGSVDFDPGPEIVIGTWYGVDYYLSKFNVDGEFLWVRTWGGEGIDDHGLSVAVDSLGFACAVGGFSSELIDFDPGPGYDWHTRMGTGAPDAFLTRFPPDGNW